MQMTEKKPIESMEAARDKGPEGSFGARLKFIVMARYTTQLQAAHALDVQPGLLNKYFADKTRPGVLFLERLAAIGINMQWLITGEGIAFAENAMGEELKRIVDSSNRH